MGRHERPRRKRVLHRLSAERLSIRSRVSHEIERDGQRRLAPALEVAGVARLVLVEHERAGAAVLRGVVDDTGDRGMGGVIEADADGRVGAQVADPVGSVTAAGPSRTNAAGTVPLRHPVRTNHDSFVARATGSRCTSALTMPASASIVVRGAPFSPASCASLIARASRA